MLPKKSAPRLSGTHLLSVQIILCCSLFLAWSALGQAKYIDAPVLLMQEPLASEPLDVNPFLNMLALALVIERLLEIGVMFFPGLEEKKLSLEKDAVALAAFELKILRLTTLIGMGLGIFACVLFRFGVLDEIFPGRHLSMNFFNHLITGIIAGAGADPVHQLVL